MTRCVIFVYEYDPIYNVTNSILIFLHKYVPQKTIHLIPFFFFFFFFFFDSLNAPPDTPLNGILLLIATAHESDCSAVVAV